MILVGIDPGGTTGLCKIEWTKDGGYRILESTEFNWNERFLIPEWVDIADADVYIMESFKLYAHEAKNQVGSDFPSCQIIGMVEARLWETHRLGRLKYQSAYCTKGVAIPGPHVEPIGGSEHRKDAYKHLRYYMARQVQAPDKASQQQRVATIPVRRTK